jgi:uncharacterized Tic20 family protein
MQTDSSNKTEVNMLGIQDPGVWLAYLLCILSMLLCVVYGAMNWDKGDEVVYPEDVKWVKGEKQVKKNI